MAVVGLVLGIISVVCSTVIAVSFTEYADYVLSVSLACMGLGLPLSWIAVRQARENAASPGAVPTVGLWINVVALVFNISWVIIIVAIGFATDWTFDWQI